MGPGDDVFRGRVVPDQQRAKMKCEKENRWRRQWVGKEGSKDCDREIHLEQDRGDGGNRTPIELPEAIMIRQMAHRL